MKRERIIELKNKAIYTLREEGVKSLIIKTKKFTTNRNVQKQDRNIHEFKDILFINGCSLPHPQRYRVDHQIEQLESVGISCAKVDYDKITIDLVKYFRGFVVYRCPITPDIEKFIKLAKENNKMTFYDIDDLVFDLKYTKKIKFLDTLSKDERDLYDNGVVRMGKTLELCEYGIASTSRLQKEMSKHLKEVVINRNVASESMIAYSESALKLDNKEKDKVVIGYFSGTITHNDDFKLIMPSIINIMKKYPHVYLKIAGLLDLPEEMEDVRNQVITTPFVSWEKLPELIHSTDINIAPLEDSIFNEAKSENKWTEASLVKVPTIASNVGAFKEVIKNNVTGFLCNDEKEWFTCLEKLINDPSLREEIGENAYHEVRLHHTTLETGNNLKTFIMNKLHKNIAIVVPSTNISGGILVAIKHAQLLKKHGYDVCLINAQNNEEDIVNNEGTLSVIPACMTIFTVFFDTMVATMWLTLEFVRNYQRCQNKKYLVQGYEVDFYQHGAYERIRANATYNQNDIQYLTISKWCKRWLEEKYHQKVSYAPNGIDLKKFECKKRNFKGKIKILVEGNSKDYYKNVDESFKIVEKLDFEKFEIHYLSYEQEPKKWYHVDKFHHKVSHDEVGKLYQECDILIKTSLLDSFAYPPLEMMATGGLCVVLPNDGNVEYLKDEENCLFYEAGNIEQAVQQIKRICKDKKLREKLIENGLKTAKKREWSKIEEEIIELYE